MLFDVSKTFWACPNQFGPIEGQGINHQQNYYVFTLTNNIWMFLIFTLHYFFTSQFSSYLSRYITQRICQIDKGGMYLITFRVDTVQDFLNELEKKPCTGGSRLMRISLVQIFHYCDFSNHSINICLMRILGYLYH